MSDQPDDSTPLGEAREWIQAEAADKGAACPCCGQFAKVYRRPINSGMARSLITMWRAAGRDWQHVPTTVGGRSREEGKLRYWRLVEEAAEIREDGGRPGVWRITADGELFVRNQLTVPRYALIYDGRLLELDGGPTNIVGALGDKFDYAELMAAPGTTAPADPDVDPAA